MKLAAIVCEYNPFHLGHEYHIEKTKELTGCDGIVAVMSGNFVQRGEPALFSKEIRAKAAALKGADLCLELAPEYAVRPAEGFAEAAVRIITSIPEIKYLSFGAEEEDIDLIKKAAQLLCEEPKAYKTALKEELKKGVSYPRALMQALNETGQFSETKAFLSPNNILAVEYIKALNKAGSEIIPLAVKRRGAGHDSDDEKKEFLSASLIRAAFLDKRADILKKGLPKDIFEMFCQKPFLDIEAFEKMLLSRIDLMAKDEIKEIPEVSEGLENRIKKCVQDADSLLELAQKIKCKRYTMARINRILLRAGLGLKRNEDYPLPPYAKILSFSEKGQEILNRIKKSSQIPIIKNMTALKKSGDKNLIRQYEKEAALDRVYKIFEKKI